MKPESQHLTAAATLPEELKTPLHYFYHWEKNRPDAIYLKQPWQGSWTDYSWKEAGDQARRIAAALRAMDLPPGSNIGLISKNCAHWIICDFAIKMSGHVSVPFYPNLTADQLGQLLEHSEAPVLFAGKLDDWESMRPGVPEGVRCIGFPLNQSSGLERWEDLLAQYDPIGDDPIPDLDQLESIVYTSGTTGTPKGVMKTYRSTALATYYALQITRSDQQPPGRFFSYLPLNHDAERVVVQMQSVINGGTIYFVESLETFADNLREAQPHYFLAVPRIWTKFQQAVLEKVPESRLNRMLQIPLVSTWLKKRIRQQLGMSNLRMAITGAAPMPESTIRWFDKLGIAILDAYGMTENSAICTLTRPENRQPGTVGQPYPGVELRIDPGTSEILMKAPWVMKGYYKNSELTAEVLRDGWLHTGDMGELTPEGHLRITGRVKDMFKTSKGEYIIPVPMERMFAANTLIDQVCVVGYGLPQPFALVHLSDNARKMKAEEVEESLEDTLEAVNDTVADYERINKVVICRDAWTVENGLLTPTQKVRRHLLDQRYKSLMEHWYNQGGDSIIWE